MTSIHLNIGGGRKPRQAVQETSTSRAPRSTGDHYVDRNKASLLHAFDEVAERGYVPLLLASLVYGLMLVWHRGSTAVAKNLGERLPPVDEFVGSTESRHIPLFPALRSFLTRTLSDTLGSDSEFLYQ
jgi:hypothetical protein